MKLLLLTLIGLSCFYAHASGNREFACSSKSTSMKSTLILVQDRLYFSMTNFPPASGISEHSPAIAYSSNQNSVYYSWDYAPSSGDTLESNSSFEVQRTLFSNGQGLVIQYWRHGCYGELCSGIGQGIENWVCSRLE